MAKAIAVCVRDAAAETFGPPFFVPNAAVAVRTFSNEVNRMDDKNQLFLTPAHFELYQVGVFDDESGFFEVEVYEGKPRPKLLARAEDLKRVLN